MIKKMSIILLCMVFLCYYFWPKENDQIIEINHGKPIESFEVTIKGAVYVPGLYKLFKPMKLSEIIDIYAFGFLEEAIVTDIDLNQIIYKNMTIVIPFLNNEQNDPIKKTNINQANYQQLIQIPFVTERIALNILMYREANGHFNSYEDILKVKYIGVATLEKIKPHITLG